ncbi:hypothetical protein TorRG33x02_083020, partial [Trema orientale]
ANRTTPGPIFLFAGEPSSARSSHQAHHGRAGLAWLNSACPVRTLKLVMGGLDWPSLHILPSLYLIHHL